MNNKRPTKRALILSMLSLLLCVSMLVGSTFAWFTDTDTTAVNNVVSGTLDIEIIDTDGNLKTTPLTFVNVDNSSDILWEPGATFQTEGFQLKNNGSLWLKFKVEINNTEVSYNKLNEAITFSLVKGDEVIPLTEMTDLPLAPHTTSDDILYIRGHMDENVGNEHQGLTLSGVSISVLATQYTKEVDMTDDQYDKDADYLKGSQVLTAPKQDNMVINDVQKLFTEGEGGIIDFGGSTVVKQSNSNYALYYPKLPSNNSVIKNLNIDGTVYGLEMHGDITFENCTFTGTYAPNISDGENNPGFEAGKVTFINCTFQGWLSFDAASVTSAEFINCNFIAGSYQLFMNSYQDTTFTNCTFDSAFGIDDELADKQTWTFTNCTGLNQENLNKTGSYKTVTIIQN